MIKANNKKICIVVSSLAKGGAERSSALLSEMLYDLGFDVHIVSVLNYIEFPYKGKLFNLGELKAKDDSIFGRLNRLRVFKKYLKEHNFDYVIDSRPRIGFLKEYIISKYIYTPKNTIYCVRSYKTGNYIAPNKFLGKVLYNSAYKIVAVSKGIYEKLLIEYGFKNLTTIYNAVNFIVEEKKIKNETSEKFILFFGRLNDDIKNVSLLLEAYSKSILPSQGVKLQILGDGKDAEKLKLKAQALGIEGEVVFLSHQSSPFEIVKSAFFTILTSRYEGFPRVIVESLALGTPVISVDCKSGPNEIIVNEFNGLLVENHNAQALTNAMNRLYEDEDLYLHCNSNAKNSVKQFSKEVIGLQWASILK